MGFNAPSFILSRPYQTTFLFIILIIRRNKYGII
nr:MAG TPA: hypothetical protein [Caudoviricetes sp.]